MAESKLTHADDPNPAEAARRVAEGNRLLNEGKAEDALKEYDAALKANPEAPETAYNRGLALYKLKKYDEAGKAFQDAIRPGRPELEAKTKYNLGRSAHAAALAASQTQGEEADQAAIGELAKAIRYYDETLQLSPTDVDAKHNRDLAERMIRYIERRVQQKKEENQKPQPSSQPSSQPNQQDPSSQPYSQPSEPQQSEDKDGDNKDEQDSKEGEQEDNNEEKSDPRARRSADQQQEMRKMTKEEAERYLQQARDAEAKRRQLRRQWEIQQRGRVPVEKDW